MSIWSYLGSGWETVEDCARTIERFDRHAAAKGEAKKKETFSSQILMLNATDQADSRCFYLLSSAFLWMHERQLSKIYKDFGQCKMGM